MEKVDEYKRVILIGRVQCTCDLCALFGSSLYSTVHLYGSFIAFTQTTNEARYAVVFYGAHK